jgi:hypothetical protein
MRDRALLLVGFAGAFRRSELVALNADVEVTSDGLVITLRRRPIKRAKGTRLAFRLVEPRDVPLAGAARRAGGILNRNRSAIPLHQRHGRIGGRLSGYAVALIVKRHAGAAGLEGAPYSGHILSDIGDCEGTGSFTVDVRIQRRRRIQNP